MLFGRKGVTGKQKPEYPDMNDLSPERRGFLAKLGSAALGAAVLGLGAVGLTRCSGDQAPPADPSGGVPGKPAGPVPPTVPPPVEPKLGGAPLPPKPTTGDSGQKVGTPPDGGTTVVGDPNVKVLRHGGDVAPPPDPGPAVPGQVPMPSEPTGTQPQEIRKPGELPPVADPKKVPEAEKDVKEESDSSEEKGSLPNDRKLGGIAPPPPKEPEVKLGGAPLPPQPPQPPVRTGGVPRPPQEPQPKPAPKK